MHGLEEGDVGPLAVLVREGGRLVASSVVPLRMSNSFSSSSSSSLSSSHDPDGAFSRLAPPRPIVKVSMRNMHQYAIAANAHPPKLNAGTELLMNYGDLWHHRHEERLEEEDESTYTYDGIHADYGTLEEWMDEEMTGIDFDTLPTEADKRARERLMRYRIQGTEGRQAKIDLVERRRRDAVESFLQDRQGRDKPEVDNIQESFCKHWDKALR